MNGVPEWFELTGAGWGHGVGLCQIGAAVMGEKGYSYDRFCYITIGELKSVSYTKNERLCAHALPGTGTFTLLCRRTSLRSCHDFIAGNVQTDGHLEYGGGPLHQLA